MKDAMEYIYIYIKSIEYIYIFFEGYEWGGKLLAARENILSRVRDRAI